MTVQAGRPLNMIDKNKCKYCGKEGVVKGTLEGVSFVPQRGKPKLMESGVYGLRAFACPECGRLSGFELDAVVLKKLTSRK